MSCGPGWSAISPVANASLPANETSWIDPVGFGWMLYLAQYGFDSGLNFNYSATSDLVRQDLNSCREWDDTCQDSSQIFATASHLGFCSLYPNLTSAIIDDSDHDSAVRAVQSSVSTCLISYCALMGSSCSSSNCTVSSLLTASGGLSGQAVGRCWLDICTSFIGISRVNPDIGGKGVGQTDDLTQTPPAHNPR